MARAEPAEHALRLVDADGTPASHCPDCAEKDARIGRLVAAIEDLSEKQAIDSATTRKWYREVLALRAKLTVQERDDADQPIVQAVFGFWKALKGTNVKLGPKRTAAILERTRDDPPSQPKEFLWPVMGIVFDPVPKDNGVGAHDSLEIALRDDDQFYKYACRGREYVEVHRKHPRDLIGERGGDAALEALDVLLALQREMYPDPPATA